MASRHITRRVAETLEAAEIDELVLGVFEVDRSGTIERYIAAPCGHIRGHELRSREARLARALGCITFEGEPGEGDPAEILGKNFFKEVAPPHFAEEMEDLFHKGVESGNLDVQLTYNIDPAMKSTQVRVRMQRTPRADEYWNTYWIIIKRA